MSKLSDAVDFQLGSDLSKGRAIDASATAARLHEAFPDISISTLTDVVVDKVIAARGNVFWGSLSKPPKSSVS